MLNLWKKNSTGFTDQPAPEDLFNIKSHIECLTTFITNCKTPITISIQGSWGSGKTSFMNLVQNNLDKDDIIDIWFNTWQFSQFDKNSNLAVSLMTILANRLQDLNPEESRVKNFSSTLKSAALVATSVAVETLIGAHAAESLSSLAERKVDEMTNVVNSIENLKKQFQQLINDRLASSGKDRVVIFVDDLDRLDPVRAVELLEVLKLFLDCDHCVFVLAIDYDVVCRGVAQKYKFTTDEMDKGRSFFDKIIQVPFKLPIASYDIHRYINQCLNDINISVEESELDIYEELIRSSMGTNPRAMKRLFNAFLLLNIMTTINELQVDKKFLFSALCLQFLNDDLYNFFVSNASEFSSEDMQNLLSGEYSRCQSLFEDQDVEIAETDYEDCSSFFNVVSQILNPDHAAQIPDGLLDQFRSALSLTATTSSTNVEIERKPKNFTVDRSYTFRLDDKVYIARAKYTYQCMMRYFNEHPGISYEQFRDAFTDPSLQKIVIMSKAEIDARFKERTFKSVFHHKHPVFMADGTEVYLSNNWSTPNTLIFTNMVKERYGYDVEAIPSNK